MSEQSFSTTFSVDESPEVVFAAVANVRGWWSEEVEGDTEKLGDTFTFEVPDVHRCTLELTEVIPNKKIVWHVQPGSHIDFIEQKSEWDETDIVFDISEQDGQTQLRFTHIGLVPSFECYEACSGGWNSYTVGSLRDLITTGKGDPYRKDGDFESEAAKHKANNTKEDVK